MYSSPRLLVVDDDIEMASNLKDIFESEGYTPVTANDARTAISLCSEHIFDIGVVDIKLPDMTGIELIEKLSQLSKKMKYIIITGNASLESAIEAVKQDKIVSYTLKPLDMNYFIPHLQQITEQKYMEEALFKVEQEKKAILNSISEPIVYHDKNHKLVWINSAAKDSVGMSYDKIIGSRCYDALARRSEPCTGCPGEKIIETGQPHENEMTMPDGSVWSIRGYPVRDMDDKITRIVETIHDITERKKAEATLQKSHDELEKRVEERTADLMSAQDQIIRSERLAAAGQLATSIAHEINSPLQAMTVLLGMMKRKYEEDKELLDIIDLLKKTFITSGTQLKTL